jgi:hypothetical protein
MLFIFSIKLFWQDEEKMIFLFFFRTPLFILSREYHWFLNKKSIDKINALLLVKQNSFNEMRVHLLHEHVHEQVLHQLQGELK